MIPGRFAIHWRGVTQCAGGRDACGRSGTGRRTLVPTITVTCRIVDTPSTEQTNEQERVGVVSEWLSTAQAAKELGVSQRHVRRLLEARRIRHVRRSPRDLRVDPDDLALYRRGRHVIEPVDANAA
ncbi:helix-turn-helix domain-containing protein [Frankia sp. AgB32]|uniref:helix-turn-helix domain-containing protein n=1 Tax=Frankia sp. AgB32 TaxID=631119 RepID=UPI00200E8F64|nr:helix-turn-helix domain-containing protein [Frankia sp. AgB32]MCK9895231.1 helix-turn-helix domain-containing protein [Frankia sp. AgB32]